MNEEEKFEPLPSEEIDFNSLTYEQFQKVDKLNFLGIAEGIINDDIIQRTPPFIYGVYGKWGSGKTWMMRAFEQYFKRKSKYATVWFDPWVYEDFEKESLFIALLRKIQEVVTSDWRKFWKKCWKVVRWIIRGFLFVLFAAALVTQKIDFLSELIKNFQFSPELKSWLGILGLVGLVIWVFFEFLISKKGGLALDEIERYYRKLYRGVTKEQLQKIDAVEARDKKLEESIRKALKRAKKERLVLLIDDFDRCLPDKAVPLLDQLKNFLAVPNVITVIGVDDVVFASMLDSYYNYSGQKIGESYLEKIIQKPYRLGSGPIADLLLSHLSNIKWLKKPSEFCNVAGECWLKWKQAFIPRRIDRKTRELELIMRNKKFLPLADFFYNKFPSTQQPEGKNWRVFCSSVYKRFIAPETADQGVAEFPIGALPLEVHYFTFALFVWGILLSTEKMVDNKLYLDIRNKFDSFPGQPGLVQHFASEVVRQIYENFQNLLGR